MKKGWFILAGVLAASILAAGVWADEGDAGGGREKVKKDGDPFGGGDKKDRPKKVDDPFGGEGDKKKEKQKDSPLGSGEKAAFGEDLNQLSEKVGLSDEQKAQLQKLKEQRDKTLERYDKANGPRLQKAEERLGQIKGGERDPQAQNMRRQLQAYIKGVQGNRERLADGYTKRMFALLKPEQRAKWNEPILKDELTKKFSLVFLSDKQNEKLTAFCAAQAKRLAVPLDPEKHAKEIEAMELRVYRTILDKKQQAEYRKMKAATSGKKKVRPERAR